MWISESDWRLCGKARTKKNGRFLAENQSNDNPSHLMESVTKSDWIIIINVRSYQNHVTLIQSDPSVRQSCTLQKWCNPRNLYVYWTEAIVFFLILNYNFIDNATVVIHWFRLQLVSVRNEDESESRKKRIEEKRRKRKNKNDLKLRCNCVTISVRRSCMRCVWRDMWSDVYGANP